MRDAGCLCLFYVLFPMFLVNTEAAELAKNEMDLVIEDDITHRLTEDLLQSVERKFQVDLERSVDMVLLKIKLLLQNGTMHIQDRLAELQGQLDAMRRDGEDQVDSCLASHQNQTSELAETALHQLVICGYALIGHDPAQAVKKVMVLKNMINTELKPLHEKKSEVYDLLKVCGHDHDSLKKVVKCVISKSPLIKSAMMDITNKLIDGVVSLTKLMAHGAMHEACLIEVIKTTEDEAFRLLTGVRKCVYANSTAVQDDVEKYLEDNNATVLDIGDTTSHKTKAEKKKRKGKKEKSDVKDMIRRMLDENDDVLDPSLKQKMEEIQKDLSEKSNLLTKEVKNDDKK